MAQAKKTAPRRDAPTPRASPKGKGKAEKPKTQKAKAEKNKLGGRGGARPGAGRPLGSGKLGQDTTSMRLPRSLAPDLLRARDALVAGLPLPGSPVGLEIFEHEVRAGFPTPSEDADGHARRVDLYTLFSPKPESTFLIKVVGWSLRDAGIHDGDYLVVDRSIKPRHGHVVVAHLEGQGLVAKRLRVDKSGTFLDSENAEFAPIKLGEGGGAKIWGVARAKAGLLI